MKSSALLVIAILLVLVSIARSDSEECNPQDCGKDECRRGWDLIKSKTSFSTGKCYPFEDHPVDTADGYTLRMFRIPNPGQPVVFLQHGILDTADTWLLNDRNTSLGYILFDAGFDVWLGNNRGNEYSRTSLRFDPDNPEIDNWYRPGRMKGTYWEFSWQHLGDFDMPAQINYALGYTHKPDLVYIGHSQGTTQAFVNFLSSNNVKGKISAFIALAPVFFMQNTESFLLKLATQLKLDDWIRVVGELLRSTPILDVIVPKICRSVPGLCELAIERITGFDKDNFDRNRTDVYFTHFPSGTSALSLVHYASNVRHYPVRALDYRSDEKNQYYYGSETVPILDPSKSQAPPTYFFYGGKDALSDNEDVKLLVQMYPECAGVFYNEPYDHLSYVWGKDAYREVYPDIINIAKNPGITAGNNLEKISCRRSD
jgi:lysosomal acid lipase/cholesteryl ester hydrolase